jgi:hypothetical protein
MLQDPLRVATKRRSRFLEWRDESPSEVNEVARFPNNRKEKKLLETSVCYP